MLDSSCPHGLRLSRLTHIDRLSFFDSVGPSPTSGCGPHYFESRPGEYVVVVHEAKFYCDDSGTHKGGTVCVLAGYLSTAENWVHFENDWRKALREYPSVPYFKMGANYHGDKPFDGWSKERRAKKLDRMIEAFSRFGESHVELSSCIDWDTYNLLSDRVKSVFPHPFHVCFHGIVSLALDWIRTQGERVRVSFVFDHQSNQERLAVESFYKVQDQFPGLRGSMLSCCFANDVYTPGLQLADLIAWQIRRAQVKLPEDGGRERSELTKIRSLYEHVPKTRVARKSGLMAFCKRIEKQLG